MGAQRHTGDDHIGLAEVRLGLTWRMDQRHEHLALTTTLFSHVIVDDGLSTGEAILIAETLEDPLRRMALLAVNRSVICQNTVNDIPERVQLRALRWLVTTVARGLRMSEHLLHRLSRNAKPTCRLALAQPINMACQSYA